MQNIIQANLQNLPYVLPELVLCAAMFVMILVETISPKGNRTTSAGITLAALLISSFMLVNDLSGNVAGSLFSGMITVDHFSQFAKLLLTIAGILVVFQGFASDELKNQSLGEYHTYLLGVLFGGYLMTSASDALMVYLSLEIVSITSFILAGYRMNSLRSSEAALKYVVYGAFASGTMLYGFSILYGLTGQTGLAEVQHYLSAHETSNLALFVSVLMILAGFAYKIASVPFHFWCPDVYEGSPTPVTSMLSVVPKAAGFAMLVRFFNMTFQQGGLNLHVMDGMSTVQWSDLLIVVSILTMTLGNLSALHQENVKRLLAYSSIAHAGYMLLGVLLFNQDGNFSVLFYLSVYTFFNLGAFYVVILAANRYGENVQDFNGLSRKSPYLAVTMGVFLFALAGLPPTSGFIGKFYIFAALVKAGSQYYWLAIVGLANSVVSLFYYVRVAKAIFIGESMEYEPYEITTAQKTMLALLVIPTILFGLYFNPLANLVEHSVHMFGLNALHAALP